LKIDIRVDHIGDETAEVAVQVTHESGELEGASYEIDRRFGEILNKFLDQIGGGPEKTLDKVHNQNVSKLNKEEEKTNDADADRQG
jgi:hypothetical protein